jgi:hypothetical protein
MQLPAISIDPALPQRQGVSLLGSTDENSNTTNDSVTAPRLGRAGGLHESRRWSGGIRNIEMSNDEESEL